MSEIYHEIKVEYPNKEYCSYFYKFFTSLSKNEMPEFEEGDLLMKLIPKDKFEFFKVHLGYGWCLVEEESPWLGELTADKNTIRMEISGGTSHLHERLIEMLRWVNLRLKVISYYEILYNSQVAEYSFIFLKENKLFEIDSYENPILHDLEVFQGKLEDRAQLILKAIRNENIKYSPYQKTAIEDFSYEYDGVETFEDYLRELAEYKEEMALKEKNKEEKNSIKEQPIIKRERKKPSLGSGIGALLSQNKKGK